MGFKVGDRVCVRGICEGVIVSIDDEFANVEFSGGCLPFRLNKLEHVPERVATLSTFRTPHGTVNVVIQNCSPEVTTLLWRFDIWKSEGRFEYDKKKPNERAKIWFECPLSFLNFVTSDLGRAAFQRMGVEEFHIE